MSNNVKRWLALLLSMLFMLSALPASAATSEYGSKCPKCGHNTYYDWGGDTALLQEPTCTQKGKEAVGDCGRCDYTKVREIPALGHNWDDNDTIIKQSTCTENGRAKHTCLRCKYEGEYSLKPLGHKWGEWYVAVEPTPSQKGYEERMCQRCKATEQRELEYTGSNQALDYTGSLLVELVNAPSAYYGNVGGVAEVVYRITNTGNTILSVHRFFSSNDEGRNAEIEYYSSNPSSIIDFLKPGESFEKTIGYVVTQSDFDNGQIVRSLEEYALIWITDTGIPCGWPGAENYAYITGDENKEFTSNVVTTTIPIKELEYTGSLSVEVVSAPEYYSGAAGEKIDITYRITNTGNTEIRVGSYGYRFDDAEGNMVDLENGDKPEANDYLKAGESYETTVRTLVTEADMMNAEIVRSFYMTGAIWVGKNGIPKGWDGAEAPFDFGIKDKIESNTATVTIPIKELEYTGSLSVEVVSAPEHYSGAAGEKIDITYRITNTGNTEIRVGSYGYRFDDAEGNPVNLENGDKPEANDYLKAGESYETTVRTLVTEDDMMNAEIVRSFYMTGVIWVGKNGIPKGWDGAEAPFDFGIKDKIESNTATVAIPVSDEPTMPVEFVKYVHSPFSDGASAGLDETITYTLTVTNNTDQTMYDVEIADPLKGGNEDAMVTMGDTLEAGESLEYNFAYTVKPKDVVAGEVVNTANLRWTFGNDEPMCEMDSNTVIVPTVNGQLKGGDLTVEKELFNQPANGEYFTVGETAVFMITVSNNSDETVFNVDLTDIMHNAEGTSETSLSVIPSMEAGVVRTFTYMYVITEYDANVGYVENEAVAVAHYGEWGTAYSAVSDLVYVPCSPSGEAYTEGVDVTLTKTVTSTPANGEYYVMGETITYDITVKNMGDVGVGEVRVCDTPVDAKTGVCTTVIELGSLEQLYVGEERTYQYSHVVNETDVMDGEVRNVAVVYFTYDGDKFDPISNYVSSPVGGGEGILVPALMLSFDKSVKNMPANGLFFVPGELVEFDITLYNYAMDMLDVAFEDSLAVAPLEVLDLIEAGNTVSVPFDYIVTEWDAMNGSLTNVATVTAVDKDGSDITLTDSVSVPTGFDGPFGVITEMYITKTETSMPSNGSYYVEGEDIVYDIFIRNDGELDFGECIMYDSQAAADISSVEHLYVGEERHFPFVHTVTAADVAAGCVYNTAWVEYDNNGYTETKMSNTVISDTDGVEDVFVPGEIIIPPVTAEDYVPCQHELIAKGDNGEEYITHYCALHVDTFEAVTELVESAANDDELLKAWKQARDMWRGEIDEMYEVLMSSANAIANISVMDERIRFYASVGCHETFLNTVYPNEPVKVASMIAEMLMNKSVDMCYMIHTAPEDRADAFANVNAFNLNLACGEECTASAVALENGDVKSTYGLCEHHAAILQMRNRMLSSSENAEVTWKTAGQLWKIEVNTAYNKLYASLDETQKAAVSADYKAFENSIAAYENVLNALYGRPEVVNEVIAKAMTERAAELCGIK